MEVRKNTATPVPYCDWYVWCDVWLPSGNYLVIVIASQHLRRPHGKPRGKGDRALEERGSQRLQPWVQ